MIFSLESPIAPGLTPEQTRIAVISCLVVLAALFAFFYWDAKRSLRHANDLPSEESSTVTPRELDWEKLSDTANDVIEHTIRQFPKKLRQEAENVGWWWYKWSLDAGANNLLGHFWGSSRNRAIDGSAAIILYLGNIHDYCLEQNLDFEDEVRNTYLHELGHYLGLKEEDLEERGLQ
jgi:predicted Zn-dependent protease with MMP-like domain